MSSSAQPVTSQTTLQSSDTRKPSISVTGDTQTIEAIVKNDPFPNQPADITVGQLTAQAGASFKLPGVDNSSVSFSASANAALAAYQNPSNLASDLGFASADGKQLNVQFPSDGTKRFLVVR